MVHVIVIETSFIKYAKKFPFIILLPATDQFFFRYRVCKDARDMNSGVLTEMNYFRLLLLFHFIIIIIINYFFLFIPYMN